MGALGLLYGSYIQDKCGKDAVEFVMDGSRCKKYRNQTFICNGASKQFEVVDYKEAKPVDLLIVAVKYTALMDACKIMGNSIGPETIIISVLNGISSEEIIGREYGIDNIIYTVAQGMDAMKFGNELKYTRMGQLHMGVVKEKDEVNLKKIKEFFDEINMPYIIEDDILYRMWGKFMLNVGINQTCMVYGTDYEGALKSGEANRTMIAAMREVIALAREEGIGLSEGDLNYYIDVLWTLNPHGTPSMGQDRINKKASEVDMFAGTVIDMAQKHKLYVPANEFLYEQVKAIEKEYV